MSALVTDTHAAIWHSAQSPLLSPAARNAFNQALNPAVAQAVKQIPRAVVADMPDRIIAATALSLGLPLVTADTEIRKLTNITTIW